MQVSIEVADATKLKEARKALEAIKIAVRIQKTPKVKFQLYREWLEKGSPWSHNTSAAK
jgi:hypothetical protein